MQVIRKIPFENVQIGDEVFDNNHLKKFRRVTKITKKGKYVDLYVGVALHDKIDTRSCYTGHPQEDITVRINVE